MRILRRKKKPAASPARDKHLHVVGQGSVTTSDLSVVGTLLSLESRLMFDGAAVATAGAVTSEQSAQNQAEASSSDSSSAADTIPAAPTGEPQFTTDEQALFDALAAYDTSVARQEIVFLSSSILEYQQLLDGISPNVEVIILDPARDGVEQMAEALAGRTGIDAIHLIGHGTEAEIELGSSSLTQTSIGAQYAEQLQRIGGSLSAEADILIYGCNFGRGEAGQAAIQTLAALTGADVAASTDATGHVELGGDWNLEVQTGSIETEIAIDQAAQDNWSDLLGVVDWDSLAWTAGSTAPVSQALTLSDGSTVNVTVTENGAGTLVNITTSNTYTGGLSPIQDALQLQSAINPATDTITVRIDFSNQLGGSVSNVSLTLFDVDNDEYAVFNSNLGNPTSATTGATNTFNGTNRVSGNGTNAGQTSGDGNTTVTFARTGITWIEFTYGSTTAANPIVVLHDILFNSTTAGGPTLDLNGDDAAHSAIDNFDDTAPFTAAYNNPSGGAIPWATNWIEVDGVGGAQSPTAGEVRIVDVDPTAGVDGEIRIGRDTGAASSIQRSVNLTNYINPTLSFDYRTSNTLENGDRLVVEVSDDAGVTFTTLQTFINDSAGTASLSLAGYESANTIIRFRVTQGYTVADEFFFVDNVTISAEPTGHTAAYTEGGSAVGISDTDVVITDASSANMSGATVAIARNFTAGDTLTFTNIGNITGSYDAGTGVLTITGVDTRANYQTFISSIQYSSTSDNPTVGGTMTTRTISTVVRDQTTQLPSNTALTTITITAVNDAPDIVNATVNLNENSANGTAVYNVNDFFTGTDLDRDGTAITYSIIAGNTGGAFAINPATGQITVNSSAVLNRESISSFTLTVQASDGTLTDTATITINLNDVDEFDVGPITDTNGGANAVNENATTGTLVGITASASDADATNNTITYSLTNNAGGRFQIDSATGVVTVLNGALLDYESASSHDITVRADSADGSFSTQTYTVNVNNINEPPVNVVPGAQTVAEDTALAIAGVSVSDVDGNLSTTQLSVGNGTVTVSLAGGATITAGANGTGTLTLAGTQAQINAALATLSYQGNLNFTGADLLTVTSTDGNAVVDTDTVAITVTAVANNAPSLTTNAGSVVVQGLTDVITSGELQVTDLDNTPDQLVYTVTSLPGNGHLELTTAPGVAITTFTQADINAGRLMFVHDGAVSTSESFTFTVSDGAGGLIGASTFTIAVSPFAPPPPAPPLPPPSPPPIDPAPGPIPGPGPAPGSTGTRSPVLQPPPVHIQTVGVPDELVKRVALASKNTVRAEKPDIAIQESMPLWVEPLSIPVKKMLAVGHKLAERLTKMADDLDREIEERERQTHLIGRLTLLTGMVLSAGFLAWIMRGGALVTSFLVSMPAWRRFDPLPILKANNRDRRKHDREVQAEHEREDRQFHGIDRILKPFMKPTKPQEKDRGEKQNSQND